VPDYFSNFGTDRELVHGEVSFQGLRQGQGCPWFDSTTD
jgi:hypothetical protein